MAKNSVWPRFLTGCDGSSWYRGRMEVLSGANAGGQWGLSSAVGSPEAHDLSEPLTAGAGGWSTSFVVQVGVLLMSANAPFTAFSTRGSGDWIGWSNLATTGSLTACAAIVASDHRLFRRVARVYWPFVVAVGWLTLTAFWSILPSATASWLATKLPYFAAFMVICGKASLERRLAVVHASVLAAYAAGWLGSLRYPSFDRFGNEFSGSYMHNNVAAHAAVLGVVTGGFYLLLRPRRAGLVLPGIVFCLWAGEASQSDSPGSVLVVVVAVAVAVWLSAQIVRLFLRRGNSVGFVSRVFVGLAVVGVTAAWLLVRVVFRNSEGVVDLTLTRRTGIWRACLAVARRRAVYGIRRWTNGVLFRLTGRD